MLALAIEALAPLAGLSSFVIYRLHQSTVAQRQELQRIADEIKQLANDTIVAQRKVDALQAKPKPGPAALVPVSSLRPEDTSWYDVVGIPFDVWCAAGDCTKFMGYVFAPGVIDSLAKRRDAGEFEDLMKQRELAAQLAAVKSRPLMLAPPEAQQSLIKADVRPSNWATEHATHGINWNRIMERKRNELIGTCTTCQQQWRYDYNTGSFTIESISSGSVAIGRNAIAEPYRRQMMASYSTPPAQMGVQGLYRNADIQAAEMQKMYTRAFRNAITGQFVDSPHPMALAYDDLSASLVENSGDTVSFPTALDPPNPGIRRKHA